MFTSISTETAQSGAARRGSPAETAETLAPSAAIAYPVLTSQRFKFRPFVLADIGPLIAIAGEHRVADATAGVPHPDTAEFARMCISSHSAAWTSHCALHWAALKAGESRVIGYAGLNHIDLERAQAELRFWVGWGVERGSYAVEWCAAILDYALTRLGMTRIYALQLARHPLAGHVLATLGMRQEGLLRKRIYKEGLFEDIICWAIQRDEPPPGRPANAN
jgi:RimJ/RimL family protein N-acetyltransferase